ATTSIMYILVKCGEMGSPFNVDVSFDNIGVSGPDPCIPPMITQNPADQNGCPGSQVTFTVGASGTPLNYQWQVSVDGGFNWNDISGATEGCYSFIATHDDNG